MSYLVSSPQSLSHIVDLATGFHELREVLIQGDAYRLTDNAIELTDDGVDLSFVQLHLHGSSRILRHGYLKLSRQQSVDLFDRILDVVVIA